MQSSFAETQPADGPVFVSLGMLVLDELQFPFKETLYDVPGGSGAYSTLGARLATPTAQSKTVACILLTGDDFPTSVLDQLQAWNITLQIHRIPGKKSTRGLLQYSDAQFDRKTFRYLTPPLAPSPADHLQGSPLLHAATFHALADPAELSAQVSSLLSLRNNDATTSDDHRRRPPIIIWEPRPPSCTAANLDAHVRACNKVDVFSPNHVELLALFGEKGDCDGGGGAFDRGRVEACARRFLDAAAAGASEEDEGAAAMTVVVRAGEHGCFAVSDRSSCWLPAYYNASSSSSSSSAAAKVVDTTGAGNAFLGAFAVAFHASGGDVREAAVRGTVAASFALEQVGLPEKTTTASSTSVDGRDLWNGEEFACRLREYRRRVDRA